MPQTSYNKALMLLGQIATTRPYTILSRNNPLLEQISTISFGAATAGAHTIRIIDSTGQQVLSGSAAGGGTITALIDALIADLQADPDYANVVASAVNANPDLVLTFKFEGLSYTIDFPANPATDMTLVTTQAAGGPSVGLGLAVIEGAGADDMAPLTAGTQRVLGITVRNTVVEENSGDPLDSTRYLAGSEVSIMDSGACVVQTEGAVTKGGNVYARHAVGATAFALGSLSATDDGETVLVPNASFDTTLAAAGLARVRVNLPG